MRRAVITGGTGMLGRALASRLVDTGYEVVLLVNPLSKRAEGLSHLEHVSPIACDIAHMDGFVSPDGEPVDVFFHLAWGGTFGAARDDCAAQARNISYSLDAVELASRLHAKAFVGAGSQAEYGRVDGTLSPDTPAFPENGYGMAKLAAGQLTRLRCAQLGIRHEWARILSVYGPDDGERTMVTSTIRTLLSHGRPAFTPCGQLWDYLYRDDAAEALRLIGEKGVDGSVYCVGSGEARPLSEYVTMLRDAIDPALPLGIGELPYNDRQVMHLCADIATLTRDTGFRPAVPFDEGIARTVRWARENPAQQA